MVNLFHIIQVFLRLFSCSRIFGWGEGGENFAGVVRRINPLIDSVLGQADDIMVDNNYQRVKKRLDEFEGQRQSLGRKNMLDMRYNDALMQLQSNPDALYKDKVFLDKTSPDFQQHEAFTRYNNYKAMQDPNALGPDGKPVAPMSIDDFINSDNVPSTVKDDLIAKGLLQQSKVQLDDAELQNLITTTAGLTAEDIAFRNEMNAKNLSAADYNREVRNYVMNSQGDLTSRGRLADSLFKRTAGIGDGLQIAPDKIEYKTVGDSLLRLNETTSEIKELYKNKKPDKKQILSGDERYVEEGGKFFREYTVYNDTKDELEIKRQPVSEKEYLKFLDKQLTTPEKYEMKNYFNTQYKLDLSALGLTGNKGSSNGTGDGLSGLGKQDYAQFKNLALEVANINVLDTETKFKTEQKLEQLAKEKNISVEEVKSLINKVGSFKNDKAAKNYFNAQVQDISGRNQKFNFVFNELNDQLKDLNASNFESKFGDLYGYLGTLYNSFPKELIDKLYEQVNKIKGQFEAQKRGK
jgi:hypothetical protein